MYGRQRCSEKCEFFPHYNYSKIVRGGWFPLIHVTAKNAKPLKLSLEGGGEKVWGTHV